MAAPTSRRARILTNLIAQLQTITAAGGYSRDVTKVTMHLRNWEDTPAAETPVIYVIDNATAPKYNPGKLLEWEWSVSLFVVMKNSTQMEMEYFISDVMECLGKNTTLADTSGLKSVSQTHIANITTDGQFFSEIDGTQLFRLDLQLIYNACVDAIR